MASFSTVAAVYSLGAVALSVGLVVLLHRLEPEFDPSWRMLSEYSLGRYGALMRVAFIAAGTSVIAVAVALSGSASPWSRGLIFVAIGPIGAAFIDTDPITTPRAEMSRRSNVHAVLGSLFILGFPVAATATGISAAGDPAVGPVLAWASAAPWIALAWFLGSTIRYAQPDGVGSSVVRIGWPNRVSMLVYMGWVALAAITMLR
ncbi:MAG: DUF998 domain-containing protein [Candidatus Limnocylindrales bacterium]